MIFLRGECSCKLESMNKEQYIMGGVGMKYEFEKVFFFFLQLRYYTLYVTYINRDSGRKHHQTNTIITIFKMFNKLTTTFALVLVTLFSLNQAANSSNSTSSSAANMVHLTSVDSVKAMVLALAVAVGVSITI